VRVSVSVFMCECESVCRCVGVCERESERECVSFCECVIACVNEIFLRFPPSMEEVLFDLLLLSILFGSKA